MFPVELQNYILIENTIIPEIDPLLADYNIQMSSDNHALEIRRAVDRLYAALVRQNPSLKKLHPSMRPVIKIKPRDTNAINFHSIESMLHAEISIYESEIEVHSAHGLEFSGGGAGYKKEISLRAAIERAKLGNLLDRVVGVSIDQENKQINQVGNLNN